MEAMSEPNRDTRFSAYCLGKLQEAVSTLTIHPGDARARLRAAWNLFCLSGAGVPSHLRGEYESITSKLTERRFLPPSYAITWTHSEDFFIVDTGWVEADSPYGRMVYTTETMRNRTAARLAERILTLSLMWKEWLDCVRS